MKSFSFMPKEIDASFYYMIWEEVENLKGYFYKFSGGNADEAMQRTLIHALTHYQSDKGNISAYIKKLAREITKDGGRLVFVDFLEQTLADDDISSPKVDLGRVDDFSVDIVEKLDIDEAKSRSSIATIALEYIDKFTILCEALINHDTSTSYYPEPFIKECLRLSSKYQNFNQQCINLYMQFSDDFKWFLSLDENNKGYWKETDYLLISQCQSKRVTLVNKKTGVEVEDADLEDWSISGKLGTGKNKKMIIKVPYLDIWEFMCDLVDDFETNEMKFIIDDTYIIRTLGGSFSVINPDLYNIYDLVRMEILTNLLQDTSGRLLNVGSESIYLLCGENYLSRVSNREIRGIPLNFEYIDITDTV